MQMYEGPQGVALTAIIFRTKSVFLPGTSLEVF